MDKRKTDCLYDYIENFGYIGVLMYMVKTIKSINYPLLFGRIKSMFTITHHHYIEAGNDHIIIDPSTNTPALKEEEKATTNIPEYLDPRHPYHSKKLVAAISVWEALHKQPDLLKGKSPKNAITTWLEENAGILGLLKKDGELNREGIEQVAKVANWSKGGPPKT